MHNDFFHACKCKCVDIDDLQMIFERHCFVDVSLAIHCTKIQDYSTELFPSNIMLTLDLLPCMDLSQKLPNTQDKSK